MQIEFKYTDDTMTIKVAQDDLITVDELVDAFINFARVMTFNEETIIRGLKDKVYSMEGDINDRQGSVQETI